MQQHLLQVAYYRQKRMLIPVWPRLQDPRRSLHEVFHSSRADCSGRRPLLWRPAQAPDPRAVPWQLCFSEVALFRMVPGKIKMPLFLPVKCSYFSKRVSWFIFFFLFLNATDFFFFNQCSRSCGGGEKTRESSCVNGFGHRLDDQQCQVLPRVMLGNCNEFPCPSWVTSEWSEVTLNTCQKNCCHVLLGKFTVQDCKSQMCLS